MDSMKSPWGDRERESYPLTHAERYESDSGGGWEISFDGWTTAISDDRNPGYVEPRVGDLYTFWGRVFRPYRGQAINGTVLWYRTPEEDTEYRRAENERHQQERRAKWESQKDDYFARIHALPLEFQERIAARQRNNPDFDWEYGGYELFCCEQAVLIADTIRTQDAVREFRDLPWNQQLKRVPGLSDGHSGNTFGAACSFAEWYLVNPSQLEKVRGAMAPLVGSCEYGDVPKDHEFCGESGDE